MSKPVSILNIFFYALAPISYLSDIISDIILTIRFGVLQKYIHMGLTIFILIFSFTVSVLYGWRIRFYKRRKPDEEKPLRWIEIITTSVPFFWYLKRLQLAIKSRNAPAENDSAVVEMPHFTSNSSREGAEFDLDHMQTSEVTVRARSSPTELSDRETNFDETKNVATESSDYGQIKTKDASTKLPSMNSDCSLLSILETCLETAPQFNIQLFDMIHNIQAEQNFIWNIAMCSLKFVLITWSIVSYAKNLKITERGKDYLPWYDILILFSAYFFLLTPRIIMISIFASYYIIELAIGLAIHIFIMFVFLKSLSNRMQLCDTHVLHTLHCIVFGFVYIYMYIAVESKHKKRNLIIFYTIYYAECIIYLVYMYSINYFWYFSIPFFLSFIGIILTFIFYRRYPSVHDNICA